MKLTIKQLRIIIKEEVQNSLKKSKRNSLSESMTRITQDELSQWKSGNWGYISEGEGEHPQIDGHRSAGGPSGYEPCDTCGWDHEYDFPYLSLKEKREAMGLHYEAGDDPRDINTKNINNGKWTHNGRFWA